MPTITQKNFVSLYYPAAIKAAKGSKIHPDTIITAAALESGYGQSGLAAKYNNFFGRKPEKTWKGKIVNLPTNEFINGKMVKVNQPFKYYDTPEEAFRDYVKLLSTSKRYAKVLLTTDPKQQFREIQAAGYATDPGYAFNLEKLLDSLKPLLNQIMPLATFILIGGLLYVLLKS